jgi:hypothetical protein
MRRYRLVSDLAVSGVVRWDRYGNTVTVDLTLRGTTASGATVAGSPVSGRLRVTWNTRAAGARAVVSGTLGGRHVRAWLPAP